MKYYDDMTKDEYVDSYLTQNLPDQEMVDFEFKLLDDEALAQTFDGRLNAHKAARKAFDKWSSETGFVSLQLYVDGKFKKEINVKESADILVDQDGVYEVKNDQGVVVLKKDFSIDEFDMDDLKYTEDDDDDVLYSDAACAKYEEMTEEIVFDEKKITFKFIQEE